MTSKEAFNKLQHYINGTKLSGEEYLECCKILDKGLERLEELEEQVAALDNSANNLALDLDISREENSKLKKAIDILKNKKVNIFYIWALDDYKQYKQYYFFDEEHTEEDMLTEKEFNFLKEVLEE